MAVNDKIFFVLWFILLWCYCSSFMCQKLDNQLQQLCSKMNGAYNLTASFKSVNGSSYQSTVYSKVFDLQKVLKTCSNVSELMICSSFVPKCVEGQSSPFLPCREVCEQFVDQCGSKLEERNLRVLYATMCHELPDVEKVGGECIKPEGFEKQEKSKKLGLPLNCSTQTTPACIHRNYTHLPEDIKTKLINRRNQSEPLIKNGCSEQLTRYFCYGQTTPCYIDSKLPYRPCRRFCEHLKKECDQELKLLNLSSPVCDRLPRERDRVGDLCRMDSWPVPWPNDTKKEEVQKPSWKTCHCDNCGQIKRTCETTGSCFIQRLFSIHGNMYSQRTCLQPGKQRDFICRNTKNYLYAKCCDKDYCNNKYLVNPTTIPMTAVANATSTGMTPIPNTVVYTQNRNVTTTSHGIYASHTTVKGTSTLPNTVVYTRNRSVTTTSHGIYAPHTTVKGTSPSPNTVVYTQNRSVATTSHGIYVPYTVKGTTPPNIVTTTQNSSSTSTGHDGIFIITFKITLVLVLTITLEY